MPIWLRKFTFHKIKEYNESKNPNTQAEETWTNTSGDTAKKASQNIKVPDFIAKSPPTYQTKVSQK